MAESHILLLPQADYFQWVKATRAYVLTFGVTITPDPVKAGEKQNVTVAVVPKGYPSQGDIVAWLEARFPQTKVDPVLVSSAQELEAKLTERVKNGQRYGATAPSTPPPTGTSPGGVTPVPSGQLQLLWPSDFMVITQGFGANPQIYSKWGLPGHEGLDIRAPMNTNIYVCADGDVFAVETNPNKHPYGIHVRVRHANGYSTVYAHLAKTMVTVGQKVKAKQLIGLADSTGNSTGSHLHLTLKKDGATARGETKFKGDVIDPTPFMVKQ